MAAEDAAANMALVLEGTDSKEAKAAQNALPRAVTFKLTIIEFLVTLDIISGDAISGYSIFTEISNLSTAKAADSLAGYLNEQSLQGFIRFGAEPGQFDGQQFTKQLTQIIGP